MNVTWKSHFETLGKTFPEMLTGRKFVDVTLVCEGRRIHCHRVVLAASSPYFSDLFEENPAQHPIVILPYDVKFWAIKALVDFMYRGEVSVKESGFEELVRCAGMLHILSFNKAITSHFMGSSSSNDCNVKDRASTFDDDDNDESLDLDPLCLDDKDEIMKHINVDFASERNDYTATLPIPIFLSGVQENERSSSCLEPSSSKKHFTELKKVKLPSRTSVSSVALEKTDDSQELDDFLDEVPDTGRTQKRTLDLNESDDNDGISTEDCTNQENSKRASLSFRQEQAPTTREVSYILQQNLDEIPSVQDLKGFLLAELGQGVFEENLDLDEKDIKNIVRTTCMYMMERCGNYPSSITKRLFAEMTTEIFPQLNADVLYDKRTNKGGLLESRCRYLQRQKLKNNEALGRYKKRKTDRQNEVLPDEDPITAEPEDEATRKKETENIEFLKNASVKHEKEQIIEVFRENFHHRQRNLGTVFQDYGRILRFCPELIIQEFETKYGPTPSAMETWESLDIEYVYSKLLPSKKQKLDRIIRNWCQPVARTLMFLALFKPLCFDGSGQKSSVVKSLMNFIMFFPDGSSPAQIKQAIDQETSGPQLFAVGTNPKNIIRFYVKIEDKIFSASEDFHKALDFYIKAHYAFNFKPENITFCRFMAKYIYKLEGIPTPSSVITRVAASFNLL